MVSQVLAPIIAYDRENKTRLLDSLRVFLNCNRSWKRSAEELFIHKQTLVYRIRQIEDLTGRSLSNTPDVSDFWVALRAREMIS